MPGRAYDGHVAPNHQRCTKAVVGLRLRTLKSSPLGPQAGVEVLREGPHVTASPNRGYERVVTIGIRDPTRRLEDFHQGRIIPLG